MPSKPGKLLAIEFQNFRTLQVTGTRRVAERKNGQMKREPVRKNFSVVNA
jgi:hypothetical protein